jgi:hypothetical protein
MSQTERRHERLAVRLSSLSAALLLAKHWIWAFLPQSLVFRSAPSAGIFVSD